MDVFGLSTVTSLIEKVGIAQTLFIMMFVTALYIASRHYIKKIDVNYDSLKKDNEALKEKITSIVEEHNYKLVSIEEEIRKKLGQRTNFMKNHPFFSTMDHLIDVKIPSILFKSQFKRLVFTDVLTFMVKSAQNVFKDFVMDEGNYETGGLEFRNNMTRAMNNCHSKFASECESSVIPREVMDSFNVWSSPLIRFLYSATENICESKMYETNIDKINTVLSINLAIYDEMISNIEIYLDEMNGDFVGLVYKGVRCEEEEHHTHK